MERAFPDGMIIMVKIKKKSIKIPRMYPMYWDTAAPYRINRSWSCAYKKKQKKNTLAEWQTVQTFILRTLHADSTDDKLTIYIYFFFHNFPWKQYLTWKVMNYFHGGKNLIVDCRRLIDDIFLTFLRKYALAFQVNSPTICTKSHFFF